MASMSSGVLVVDDEPGVLQLLEIVFARNSMAVTTAPTASEAVRLLLDRGFGCLLVDKNLPDNSGLTVISEAKRLHPYCACIVMTAFPSYESILTALRIGATDYLEKPFQDLPLLVQKVQRAIEQQQVAFERDTFARLVREMRTEMKKRDQQLARAQSDLEVLDELIELRVAQRTAHLTQQIEKLATELQAFKTPTVT